MPRINGRLACLVLFWYAPRDADLLSVLRSHQALMVTLHPEDVDLNDPELRSLAHAYKMGFANGAPAATSANAAFCALVDRGIVPIMGQRAPFAGHVILASLKRLPTKP